jgi:hypothetical protein
MDMPRTGRRQRHHVRRLEPMPNPHLGLVWPGVSVLEALRLPGGLCGNELRPLGRRFLAPAHASIGTRAGVCGPFAIIAPRRLAYRRSCERVPAIRSEPPCLCSAR